jgi:predicted transcriptional regulator
LLTADRAVLLGIGLAPLAGAGGLRIGGATRKSGGTAAEAKARREACAEFGRFRSVTLLMAVAFLLEGGEALAQPFDGHLKRTAASRMSAYCVTLSHLKGDTITVRLDDDLAPLLDEVCRRSRRTRSEVMREALRRHLAQLRFEQLRRRVMPFAEARGYLTDEDVFDRVS